ncbi:hypothetical protein [Pseudomonas sp. LRF_L74]|uniref:hypothetical protein n=1 Tax=Pseudomonas sp. LRF_L74 TaxID=3369422 RepID=UPI003F612800
MTNPYGLDADYFNRLFARELHPSVVHNQSPDCLARVLARAARTASSSVLAESEFQFNHLVRPGQIEVGDELRFHVAGELVNAKAEQVLHPGSEQEEVVWDSRRNHYFNTCMAIDGTSSHKQVLIRIKPGVGPEPRTALDDDAILQLFADNAEHSELGDQNGYCIVRQRHAIAIAGALFASMPVHHAAYRDAYRGAREDLAGWKRRALEAEAAVRQKDQIIQELADDLNNLNGATFVGELRAGADPEQVPDSVFTEQFMAWWESEGQYCRSGGGNYERVFAFQAWRYLYPLVLRARAATSQNQQQPEPPPLGIDSEGGSHD